MSGARRTVDRAPAVRTTGRSPAAVLPLGVTSVPAMTRKLLAPLPLAAVVLAGALASCSTTDQGGAGASTTAGNTTSSSSATTSASAPSASTTSATTTSASSAQPTSSGTPSASNTSSKPALPPDPPIVMVDAAQFRSADGYYFTSPSGNLRCGYTADFVGCQAVIVVSNLLQCNRPAVDKAPIVTYNTTRGVRAECTNQGIFIRENAKVLPYDHGVRLGPYVCISMKTNVRCIKGQAGFTASK